jgi:S-adenosylmethionine-diacylgycerolhomoserine-N-methlytransferase
MSGNMMSQSVSEPHARRMDAIYRSQRHFYDLTRKYYLLGRDRLIDRLAPSLGETVLEVGCGTGRNLILAARRWPNARFFGLDISEAMLETARANVAKAGLTDKISFAVADATAFDSQALFGIDGFDRIFQSYTLSMIPDWQEAVREGVQHLAPTGQLHIVDFGQQEGLLKTFRAILWAWLAKFHVEPRAALREVVETAAAGRRVEFASLYRGYAWAVVVG